MSGAAVDTDHIHSAIFCPKDVMALKMDFNENDEVSKTPPKLVDKIGQLYLTDLSIFEKIIILWYFFKI